MESEESIQWKSAIEDEYKSLLTNCTWILVKRPTNQNVVGCNWVFKIKPGYTRVPEWYKARLVAKGFTQCYGIDYNETFSPVLKYNSLRTILSITVHHNLEISLLYVKTAFLYRELNEQVFMEQPKGFLLPGKEHHVYLLKISLYGLKQASWMWNEKFNTFLLKFGLSRSEFDPCIYYYRKEKEIMIVAIFVDDGRICASNKLIAKNVIDFLSLEFDVHSLPATRFLGLDFLDAILVN